jgi:hypothetical protein
MPTNKKTGEEHEPVELTDYAQSRLKDAKSKGSLGNVRSRKKRMDEVMGNITRNSRPGKARKRG